LGSRLHLFQLTLNRRCGLLLPLIARFSLLAALFRPIVACPPLSRYLWGSCWFVCERPLSRYACKPVRKMFVRSHHRRARLSHQRALSLHFDETMRRHDISRNHAYAHTTTAAAIGHADDIHCSGRKTISIAFVHEQQGSSRVRVTPVRSAIRFDCIAEQQSARRNRLRVVRCLGHRCSSRGQCSSPTRSDCGRDSVRCEQRLADRPQSAYEECGAAQNGNSALTDGGRQHFTAQYGQSRAQRVAQQRAECHTDRVVSRGQCHRCDLRPVAMQQPNTGGGRVSAVQPVTCDGVHRA
jgi:hypothetical protein